MLLIGDDCLFGQHLLQDYCQRVQHRHHVDKVRIAFGIWLHMDDLADDNFFIAHHHQFQKALPAVFAPLSCFGRPAASLSSCEQIFASSLPPGMPMPGEDC